jgi:isopenicillin N synthase-like dioxygenase
VIPFELILPKEWSNLRSQLFSTVSTILDSTEPLIGTPSLDYESLGVNFYDSDRLGSDSVYFIPAHMDSGTLTILVRAPEAHDGLEIADLGTTERLDSEGIGLNASFISVPAMADEVIVLVGTRLQRLLGKSKVRACVHRVCSPTQIDNRCAIKERLSLAIFCGPPPI